MIETRYYDKGEVLALVHRTAFRTAKGKLVRSILFPKPSRFKCAAAVAAVAARSRYAVHGESILVRRCRINQRVPIPNPLRCAVCAKGRGGEGSAGGRL